ncbi:hypothetical protein [Yinghuangia sp. YIM S10712]
MTNRRTSTRTGTRYHAKCIDGQRDSINNRIAGALGGDRDEDDAEDAT